MHRKMRKFNRDSSARKADDSLVMDYAMGDMIAETVSRRRHRYDFDYEDIDSPRQTQVDNSDINAWISGTNIEERQLRSNSYANNRQLYDSFIDDLSLSYRNNSKDIHRQVHEEKPEIKEEAPHKTAIEQLSEMRGEQAPVKPFVNRAEEVKYQFSEKKRREEIRKFTMERQQENRIKSQKDEDRRRTEELKKLFDLEDGDEYIEPSKEEEFRIRNDRRIEKKTEEDDDSDFINASGSFDPSKIKSRESVKTESHHHRHTSHRHSKVKKVFRIIRNIVLISLVVVIGLAGIGYGAYRLLDYTGGISLYKANKDQAPDMSSASMYENISMDDGQIPLTASASSWQPGWIRYDGKTYAFNSNLLTFLVLGIDSMEEVHEAEDGLSGGQSDAMFFLILDPDNKDIKIIAINRNTMTDIDVYNEEGTYVGTGEAQICLQHGFGDGLDLSCQRTVDTVKNLFHELPIAGYISINMGAIPTVNDTVGGVTLEVMYDLPSFEQYRALRKGETVKLSGDDAYWYTQHRDITDDYSANERLERQLQYLIEFIPALQERVMDDPTSVASIYNALSPYMVTDIGINEAVYLGNEAAGYNFDYSNIYQMKGESVIGDSGFEEFIYDEDGLYDLIIDVFYTEVDA